jgi:pimeloyl-ACP methyl ester carboxylesterase
MVERFRQLAKGEEVGLVGHSFGGLLFRQALAQVPQLKVRHLVMLGTPNQPPRLAPRVYTRSPLKFLRSELGLLLANRKWYSTLPPVSVPYTIVSGTKGWRGKLSPFDSELNDAIVSVSETVLSEQDRPVLISAIHTFIMNKRAVFELIEKRLRSAR